MFYESLFRQKPSSKMALVWCIEHGVLPMEEAKRLFPEYEKAKVALRDEQKVAAAKQASKRAQENAAKRARVSEVTVSEGDVGMSVGGVEGVGTVTM